MKVIRTSIKDIETNPLMLYKMTQSKATKSVIKLTDEELDKLYTVDSFVEYEDVNNKGEVVTILAILSGDTVLAAQSATFRETFNKIVDIVGDHRKFTIAILTNVSKNGRRFVDCDLRGID